MTAHYSDTRKIDPARGRPAPIDPAAGEWLGDGTPNDADRIENLFFIFGKIFRIATIFCPKGIELTLNLNVVDSHLDLAVRSQWCED